MEPQELSTLTQCNTAIGSVTMIAYTRRVLTFEARDDTMTCGDGRDTWPLPVDRSALRVLGPLDS